MMHWSLFPINLIPNAARFPPGKYFVCSAKRIFAVSQHFSSIAIETNISPNFEIGSMDAVVFLLETGEKV